MDQLEALERFAAALAIGGLIGLERERSKRYQLAAQRAKVENGAGAASSPDDVPSQEFAGIRTFSLISLCGAVTAFLTQWFGPAMFVGAFAAFTILVAVAYVQIALQGVNLGITTAVTALLVFALSGLCMHGPLELCGAVAITVYLILAFKPSLHALARAAEPEDLAAIGKFGAITLLVLPILPDRTFGPFDVLNPRKIWMMVILISAVSLVGYLAVKVIGSRRGFGLTGLVGGLASSTATTLAFSRRSREVPSLALSCALAILLACTVMLPRIAGVVWVLNRGLLSILWIPMAAMAVAGVTSCVFLYRRSSSAKTEGQEIALKNPFELGPALKFAGLYAVVLLAASALQHYLGNAGLYLSGIAAGLTDVDAISVSMARLASTGSIETMPAVATITLAAISNSITKASLARSLADPVTGRWVFWTLLAQALVGGAVLGAMALLG